MAKITVDLEAFYGYGCSGHGYGSNEAIEVEISDSELAALKKLGKKKVSSESVVNAIEDGDPTLESLHDHLCESFYYMVEEYWLFEADNECLYDCLRSSLKEDVSNGLYAAPIIDPDGFKHWKEDLEDFEEYEDYEDDDDLDDDEDFEDDDDLDDDEGEDEDNEADNEADSFDYNDYDLDDYYEWLKRRDHEFVAERVGLDLDACRDDEVCYTITID